MLSAPVRDAVVIGRLITRTPAGDVAITGLRSTFARADVVAFGQLRLREVAPTAHGGTRTSTFVRFLMRLASGQEYALDPPEMRVPWVRELVSDLARRHQNSVEFLLAVRGGVPSLEFVPDARRVEMWVNVGAPS